jgi:hypothetical protein
MNVLQVFERKPEVRGATLKGYVQQRIAHNAQELSRAGRMAARVEIANEALCRLTQLAYELDTDGELCNVDRVTYRLLIAAPFGSKGWKGWKLRRWEARALAAILRNRQANFKPGKDRPPLFVYDPLCNGWSLNIGDYDSLKAAQWWLQKEPITVKEWRQYATAEAQKGAGKGAAKGAN